MASFQVLVAQAGAPPALPPVPARREFDAWQAVPSTATVIFAIGALAVVCMLFQLGLRSPAGAAIPIVVVVAGGVAVGLAVAGIASPPDIATSRFHAGSSLLAQSTAPPSLRLPSHLATSPTIGPSLALVAALSIAIGPLVSALDTRPL